MLDAEGPKKRQRGGRKKPTPPPIPVEPPEPLHIPEPFEPEIPEAVERERTLSAYQIEKLQRIAAELAARRIEALKLYEPLPHVLPFHTCMCRERILRGSNRAGKTLAAAVEVARAVTGQDPYRKFPRTHGRAYLVGKDGRHIAEVMYRKLFRAGAYFVIRDEETNHWRAFRPWDERDVSRKREAKPAPPLVPPRLVKAFAWENKRENQPSLITLKNGWEILCFSSLGKPPQGSDIDLAWFDEEIVDPEWYPEISARLVDRSGHFIWSATPQAGTEQLFNLHERAEDEEGNETPSIVEFKVLLADNPHLTRQQKEEFAAKMTSDEERRVRIGGEYAVNSSQVYAEFNMVTHGVEPTEIPPTWSRYMVVDPGRQICAVLFAAVPPEGDHVFLYDELYIRNCTAEIFAEQVFHRTRGQVFQTFLIDHRGARVTEMASGRTVEAQYSEALQRLRVDSVETGSNFRWGSDDVQGGILAAKSWLRIRRSGTPKLRVFHGRLPNFQHEIKRYRNKIDRGVISDAPNQRNCHLMDCLRYLAVFDPRYIKPPEPKQPLSPAARAMREKRKKQRLERGGPHIRLGPGKDHK